MMTRDNYESFFLDYLEGKLEENMIDEFLDFLKQNSDLKEELRLFENIHLPEEQIVFSGKKHLYKSFTDEKSAFEIKTIALMEGDLKDDERDSFEVYLANHPEMQKEFDLFGKTRLVADTGIEYPDKQKLYRKSGSTIFMSWIMRAAAIAIIIWGVQSLFQSKSHTNLLTSNQKIVSVKPPFVAPEKEIESKVKSPLTESGEMLASKVNAKPKSNHKLTIPGLKTKPVTSNSVPERDLTVHEKINPMIASLEIEPIENELALPHSVNIEPINDTRHIMTVDEFLASRVKKAGGKGLLSANRIIRIGLSVASELSGNRLGYKVINGKIASLDFESKLMAFSIPLEKK